MSDKALKNIFLNEFHLENGAKFVPFAGYEMPINYKKGIINEHLHVREKAGIFDVSHMGQILIPANDKNISSLETYIPLNINNIPSNKCHYSFMLNKKGGIVDDIMMSKININNQENIYIVYNASRKKILNEIFSNICENYSILKNSCLIAIQGPSSYSVLNSFLDLSKIVNFLDINIIEFDNTEIYISRSGYTGEDGFEISIPNKAAENVTKTLLKNKSVELVGLGARDSLRLEAGLCLYGQDIDTKTSPVAAGLKWAMHKSRLSKGQKEGSFPGANTILSEIKNGSEYKLAGFVPLGKAPIRTDTQLFDNGTSCVPIGRITSGLFSPTQKHPIALGYIKSEFSHLGHRVNAQVRGKLLEVEVTSLPFVKKNFKKN